jgi:hypothetical protein
MSKFVSFAKDLLTNRLGIVLVALNLCVLAPKNFVYYAFTHQHGTDCLIFKNFFFIPVTAIGGPDNSLWAVNIPAIVLAQIPAYFVRIFTSDFCVYTQTKFNVFFLAVFVVLQWLFIAWAAKMIAWKIRQSAEANL